MIQKITKSQMKTGLAIAADFLQAGGVVAKAKRAPEVNRREFFNRLAILCGAVAVVPVAAKAQIPQVTKLWPTKLLISSGGQWLTVANITDITINGMITVDAPLGAVKAASVFLVTPPDWGKS